MALFAKPIKVVPMLSETESKRLQSLPVNKEALSRIFRVFDKLRGKSEK